MDQYSKQFSEANRPISAIELHTLLGVLITSSLFLFTVILRLLFVGSIIQKGICKYKAEGPIKKASQEVPNQFDPRRKLLFSRLEKHHDRPRLNRWMQYIFAVLGLYGVYGIVFGLEGTFSVLHCFWAMIASVESREAAALLAVFTIFSLTTFTRLLARHRTRWVGWIRDNEPLAIGPANKAMPPQALATIQSDLDPDYSTAGESEAEIWYELEESLEKPEKEQPAKRTVRWADDVVLCTDDSNIRSRSVLSQSLTSESIPSKEMSILDQPNVWLQSCLKKDTTKNVPLIGTGPSNIPPSGLVLNDAVKTTSAGSDCTSQCSESDVSYASEVVNLSTPRSSDMDYFLDTPGITMGVLRDKDESSNVNTEEGRLRDLLEEMEALQRKKSSHRKKETQHDEENDGTQHEQIQATLATPERYAVLVIPLNEINFQSMYLDEGPAGAIAAVNVIKAEMEKVVDKGEGLKPELFKIMMYLDPKQWLGTHRQDVFELQKLEKFLTFCVQTSSQIRAVEVSVHTCQYTKDRFRFKQENLQRLSRDEACTALFLAGTVWMYSSGTFRSDVVIDQLEMHIEKSGRMSKIVLVNIRNYPLSRHNNMKCGHTVSSGRGYFRAFWPHIFDIEERFVPRQYKPGKCPMVKKGTFCAARDCPYASHAGGRF